MQTVTAHPPLNPGTSTVEKIPTAGQTEAGYYSRNSNDRWISLLYAGNTLNNIEVLSASKVWQNSLPKCLAQRILRLTLWKHSPFLLWLWMGSELDFGDLSSLRSHVFHELWPDWPCTPKSKCLTVLGGKMLISSPHGDRGVSRTLPASSDAETDFLHSWYSPLCPGRLRNQRRANQDVDEAHWPLHAWGASGTHVTSGTFRGQTHS